MTAKRVAVIEGEDAAPEAVRPTIALIDSLGLDIEWSYPAVGDRGIAGTGLCAGRGVDEPARPAADRRSRGGSGAGSAIACPPLVGPAAAESGVESVTGPVRIRKPVCPPVL